MKGIKFIFGALAVASLLGFSYSANAQENGNRDENNKVVRGSYLTNRFGDNWFIGVGGGVNSFVAKDVDFSFPGGAAAEGFVGKWFTPSVGARLGYRGIKNSFGEEFLQSTPAASDANEWNQHTFHADLLWNISNAFSGYKETRFWDFIPYAQFGVFNAKQGNNTWDYLAGAGLINDFRLGKRVDLYLDLSCGVSRNSVFSNISDSKFAFLPSATLGLTFNLGRTNFDRHSSVLPVVVPVPFTTDQYNALKNRVEALEKENAELKKTIEDLKNAVPDTVYAGTAAEFHSPATLYFEFDKAVLSERELAHLDFYVKNVFEQYPDREFVLTGSADKGTGSAAYNQKLSEKRVNYVKDLLVNKYGVSADKLVVKAEGAANNRFSSPALNRVVIID